MRLSLYIGIVLIALWLPWWLFFPVALLYAYWVTAYELIVLGVFVDAQFGGGASQFPYVYTIALCLIVLSAELLKPYLVFYRT